MNRKFAIVLLVSLFLSTAFTSVAQTVERVSLLTCGPGSDIYELEGHTALRLQFNDNRDLTVNWGTFDFNSPNFIYRFVKGETDYRMAILPFDNFIHQYKAEGRRVTEREIYLDSVQRQRLLELIDSTLTKGSPVYRYNYVKDNCATRPLDYISKAIGQPIPLKEVTALSRPTQTFREDMTAFHENYPWYQFGIDLALGSGIDYKLVPEEHKFAPLSMDLMVEGSRFKDGSPIFGESHELLPQNGGGPEGPTPLPLSPGFICWIFLAFTIIISNRDMMRKKISRWFDCFYYTLCGIGGLLLTFLIFISVHEATSPNWLYLWLNPLCFIGAYCIWIKKCLSTVIWWQIVNFVFLIALVVLALTGVQSLNNAFIPLIASDAMRSIVWIQSAKWTKRK